MADPLPSCLIRVALLALCAPIYAGCGDQTAAQPGGPGGPPPTGVTLLTLESKPIEQTSEFIATLDSMRSTTIQSEVEGIVTDILVKSGDRVSVGTPLVQIDQERQAAAVRSAEASRAGAEADVQYWRQQVKRLASLLDAGAISRQEYEQAQTAAQTAEARLAALNAQVREGRVQLQYFRLVAPQAGVVGDIPIRKGDRVTRSTIITTIDQNEALEAYIQVPLDRAPDLRLGLPVHVISPDGRVVASNPISFVAPRVDEATQSVLVKSLLKDAPRDARVQQFVRVRIVWSSRPGLTVPVIAVSRISGQYFCFVAEPQGEGLVARQRPIRVGSVLDDDYEVLDGLKAGERVIVSGIQKIGDGAPVRAEQ